eukprot:3280805-Rhodomonas_salina.2
MWWRAEPFGESAKAQLQRRLDRRGARSFIRNTIPLQSWTNLVKGVVVPLLGDRVRAQRLMQPRLGIRVKQDLRRSLLGPSPNEIPSLVVPGKDTVLSKLPPTAARTHTTRPDNSQFLSCPCAVLLTACVLSSNCGVSPLSSHLALAGPIIPGRSLPRLEVVKDCGLLGRRNGHHNQRDGGEGRCRPERGHELPLHLRAHSVAVGVALGVLLNSSFSDRY